MKNYLDKERFFFCTLQLRLNLPLLEISYMYTLVFEQQLNTDNVDKRRSIWLYTNLSI